MSSKTRKWVDPSWPRRPPGGQWGDPAAPKFNYGPSCWNPWDQDLNWREVIKKENKRHFKLKEQLAERLLRGEKPEAVEIETAQRVFGDSNLLTKLARRDPQTSMKVSGDALEKALRAELKSLGKGAQDAATKLAVAQKARVEAELRAAVAQAEKQNAMRELLNLKRSVGGLKMLTARSSVSSLTTGSVFTTAGRRVASPGRAPSARGRSAAPSARSMARSMRRSASAAGALTGRSVASTARSAVSRPATGRSGLTYGSGSYASDTVGSRTSRTAGSSVSRISRGSALRTPKTWRGKSLDELLAEKRAKRLTARTARGGSLAPHPE